MSICSLGKLHFNHVCPREAFFWAISASETGILAASVDGLGCGYSIVVLAGAKSTQALAPARSGHPTPNHPA